jgi:hypothetical protein
MFRNTVVGFCLKRTYRRGVAIGVRKLEYMARTKLVTIS